MAYVNMKFTLVLNNECLEETYASVFFQLNDGPVVNMSKTIAAESNGTFEETYLVDDFVANTMHVTGDYNEDFPLEFT